MAKRHAICGKTQRDLWQNASHFATKRISFPYKTQRQLAILPHPLAPLGREGNASRLLLPVREPLATGS